MKKIILLCALLAAATTSVQAQRDTLPFDNEYYHSRRAFSEITPVTKSDIVMLGNSLTERGLWGEYFRGIRVMNRGIGGDCISGMINRLPSILQGKPKAVFIMGGINDLLFSKISYEKLLKQYERLLDIIASESPHTKIYIQSLLPVNESYNEKMFGGQNERIIRYNALLREMAGRRGLTFIDIWSDMQQNGELPAERTVDGIHLSGAGYIVWIKAIRRYIYRV